MRRLLIAGVGLLACSPSGGADAPEDGSTGASGEATTATTGEVTTTMGEPTDGPGETGAPMGPADGSVTYHRDLRPLIERSCVGCHQDGQIAPFALTSYEEVWPLRELIGTVVERRTMPPWMPRPGCAEYKHDPSLSEEEIAMVLAWVDEDGPLGQPDDYVAPEAPEPEGISRVDVTLTVPEPYTPQMHPDDYRCFLMDWPETETSYVTGFEVHPDNVETVHHVITFAIEPSAVANYEQLDADDPGPGYTCFGGPGGGDWLAGRWLGGWSPGGRTSDFPAGVGLKMEPGSKVVMQVHYNAAEAGVAPDQSWVDFKVDASVEREGYMMPWANPDWLSGGMPIPAGAPATVHRWELDPTLALSFLTDAIPAFAPFEIYSASHHMHLRGTKGRQVIKRADGSEDCLLEIPHFDFNWQTRYAFAEPKLLEPGDTLMLECEWDNSDNDAPINWGEGTGDEMCLGVYFIAPPAG